MVQALLKKFIPKHTTKSYVTNSRIIKKAIKASMKDQRDLIERADKMRGQSATN